MASTTVQDILQCRRKASTTLHLHLDHLHTSSTAGNNYDLPRAVATLANHHSTIRRVDIPLQPFYVTEPQWGTVPMAQLFAALSELQALESITIKARTLAGNPFPLGLLSQLVWQGRNRLRYLHVDVQRLQCLSRSVRRMAQVLKHQTCLEWVKLKYSKLLTNHNHSSNQRETVDFRAMDPILCTLGSIPTLKHVQLVGTSEGEDNEFAFDYDEQEEVFPTLNPGALVQLLASPTLQELRLEWMDLDPVAIGSLSTALQSSSTRSTSCLQKLVLGLFPEDHASMKAFAGMLQHNTTLEIVHIHTSWRPAEMYSGATGSATNHSKNGSTDASMEKFLIQIGKALRYNTHLTEFHLCGPTIEQQQQQGDMPTPKAQEALVTALKWSNCVLTSLKLGSRDSREGEISGPLAYYLQLNQLNRQHFVHHYEQVTVEEWIAILAKAGSDLNSVFYFLRLNPFLCCHQKTTATVATTTKASLSPLSSRSYSSIRKSTTYNRQHTDEGPHQKDPSGILLDDGQDHNPQNNQRTNALTRAVATMIESVATTLEIELQYRDEREKKLEQEVERLQKELAALRRQTRRKRSTTTSLT